MAVLQSPIPSQVQADTCYLVGQLMLNWSAAEHFLDMWIASIFHGAPDRPKETHLPRQFKRKIDFLKRSFNQVKALQPLKSEAMQVLDYLVHLSVLRHGIAHGFFDAWQAETETYTFIRVNTPENTNIHEGEPLYFTRKSLVTHA